MSTFQVSVTPTRVKQMRRLDEVHEPTDVFMGPFTPKATVSFVDIPTGKTARRFVTVHNKFEDEVKILVTKAPKTELCISLSWTSNVITSNSTVSLEIVWNPVKAGIFKDTVQLTDSRGNKKDVYLTMKSIEVKKPGAKKAPAVLPKRLKTSPQRSVVRKQVVMQQKSSILKNSENRVPAPMLAQTPGNNKTRILGQSSLNATNIFNTDGMNFSNLDNLFPANRFDKENKSPITPPNPNPMNNFEKVTPKTQTIPKECSTIDYLASLPTPKAEIRSGSPERVRFNLPDMSISRMRTPILENQTDISVMANMPTPNGVYETASKTIKGTPSRANVTTTNFAPHIFSTITKMAINEKDEDSLGGKELFFDAMDETFGTTQKIGSMERLSTETYIKGERMSSETYVKCMSPSMSIHEEEMMQPVMDKTRVMTPPPPLSMIVEESEVDTTKQEGFQKTFNVNDRQKTPPNKAKKAVEELVMTPLSRARLISQSSTELNKQDLDILNLKSNQGSMPNLFDDRSNEQLRNIENNRYFFQNKPTQQLEMPNESMVSNLDTMFRESEIRAQSSHLNLHEIGKSTENIVVFNKTVTKHLGMAPAMSCLDFTKCSRDSLNSSSSSVNSQNVTRHNGVKPYVSTSSPQLNRGSSMTISPPKTRHLGGIRNKDGFVVPNVSNRTKTWGAKQPKKLNLYKYPVKLTLQAPQKPKEEERVILYNPDLHISAYINPDPFAATTTADPFLASSMYLDERSTDRHEQKFKKWLNALVEIPADLDSNKGKIDMGKLFNEVQNKKHVVPDTREKVVSKYYKTRLDFLRVQAIQLYQSREVSEILTKLMPQIEKNSLVIREDKDLHLQIGLQQQVLDLLFSFNTLWLRLGLEVVFGEIIPMSSNSDVTSLARFIIDRMFKDQYLDKKYSKVQLLSPTHKEQVKKHTLKKFFCLLLFLDTAKNKKIIKQNPCLFIKASPYKETREIVLRFSTLMLSSIGDVTKYLKRYGYVLTHKQTYLDEFDYAFTNLAVDLRDGIRLTKVMEIISLREDLSCQLRVPAVSRLQKVHNVDVALKALAAADYEIKGDITAKDIADGHREKTLSLLWQIIHKFRAPKFNAAAVTIQRWWRRSWLRIHIARRIEEKRLKRMTDAATTIQRCFRGYRTRIWFIPYKLRVLQACVTIQKNIRRYQAMKSYKIHKMRQSQDYCATKIQSYYKMKQVRRGYLMFREATITIQRFVRGFLQMKRDRTNFILTQMATTSIQARYRAQRAMKVERRAYLRLRSATIVIQQRLRATLMMKEQRKSYLETKNAAISLQNCYRALLTGRAMRKNYLETRQAAILIQNRFRANQKMKKEVILYQKIKVSTISIQKFYRGYKLTQETRENFIKTKSAAIVLQKKWRATLEMRKVRVNFLQMQFNAVVVQQKFRGLLQQRVERSNFLKLKHAAITFQRQFRALRAMRAQRLEFLRQKSAAITLQRRFRAKRVSYHQKIEYLTVKRTTIVIQRRFRAILAMKRQRMEFLQMKSAVTVFQVRYRALIAMRKQRIEYENLKKATLVLQNRFRAQKLMKEERAKYLKFKYCVVKMQERVRAMQEMKKKREEYLKLRRSTVIIQQKLRATLEMRHQRVEFLRQKSAVTTISRKYRATVSMKHERSQFLTLKRTVITIQRRFRAILAMRVEQKSYQEIKKAAICLQTLYRAQIQMREQKRSFIILKQSVIVVQRIFRANILMKKQRTEFINLKNAVVNVQNRFRAQLAMKLVHLEYEKLKIATVTIQKRWRAVLEMRKQRIAYLEMRQGAIVIQERYRARCEMRKNRQDFTSLRQAAIVFQRRFRARQEMIKQRIKYLTLLNATLTIQMHFRALREMQEQKSRYLELKSAAISLQKHFRSYLVMKSVREDFLKKRNAVIIIQQRFRAIKEAARQRENYLNLRQFVIKFQARIRGHLGRIAYNARLTPEVLEARRRVKAARKIQAIWRGFNCRKKFQTQKMKQISKKLKISKKPMNQQKSVKEQIVLDIGILKGTYRVYEAITILKRLERMSRIIPQILIPHAGFISTFCYGLMALTIRSEPDKQVIELCACIILNLSRYSETKEVAFSEYGLMTIAQMLLRWCDKECGIFITLCTLIWIFGHNPEMNEKIRKFMVTPDAIYMLRETKKLTLRKEKMRQTVNKQFGSYLNDGVVSNSLKLLPNLEPDYGLIKGKPYVFMSPSFGLETVLKKFNVQV